MKLHKVVTRVTYNSEKKPRVRVIYTYTSDGENWKKSVRQRKLEEIFDKKLRGKENVTSGLFHTSEYVNFVGLFDVTFGLLHLLFHVEIRDFVGNPRGKGNLRKEKERERKREK